MTESEALNRSLVARCSIRQRPNSGAVILGLALSLFSLIGSLAVAGSLKVLLPEAALGKSAASSIAELPTFSLYALAVLLGPLLELLEFQVIPVELLRRIGASSRTCVILSALVFGSAHYLYGGLAHGASTFAAGLIFAYGYVLCRPFGWFPACLAAFTAHAAHNAVMVSLLVMFPQWASA